MRVGRVHADELQRLAGCESESAPVLSLYLNLDPSEFAIPSARSTQVQSLVDDAHRRIKDQDGLSHDERKRGLQAVERVRAYFEGPDFARVGAASLGVFCAADNGLFEVVSLPRPVQSEVVIGRKPFIEPLVDMASGGGWCILLVDRETARILRGSTHVLDEVAEIEENPARGQHDQGGWSQARYERSVEKDVEDHVKRVADVLHRRFRRAPFEHLLIGARSEFAPSVEERLHPDLRRRIAGRIDVDVRNATPEDVLDAARATMEEQERQAGDDALNRLRERVQDGRGTTGLDDTLEALTERRVETLLLVDGFSADGVICSACGWLGPPQATSCPADGTPTEPRDDIADLAISRALGQSAQVMVPRDGDAVREMGGVAAILRF